jgi:hypothetical protein
VRPARLVILATVAMLAVAACSRGASHSRGAAVGARAQQPGPAEGPPINWDAPLMDGITEPSLQPVQAVVPFALVQPAFGTPDLIQVDDPSGVPADELTVAFVYHLASYGTVNVEEREPGYWTLDQMQQRADEPIPTAQGATDTPTPGSTASIDPFTMVPVRGTMGLLVQGQGLGRIIWNEGGTQFDITGPTLTPDQTLELAATL